MSASSLITAFLDRSGFNYEITHHQPSYSAQSLAAEEHVTGHMVAKTVVCMSDNKPILLVLRASDHVNLIKARLKLGSETLSIASPEEIAEAFPYCNHDIAPAPLPLWKGVMILADVKLKSHKDILFAGGSPTDAILMRTEDWIKVAKPQFGYFSQSQEREQTGIITIDIELYDPTQNDEPRQI